MRHRIAFVLALVLWAAAAGLARADPTDDFVREQMKRQNIPGLSLAVLKNGVIVKAAGYGVADRARQTPATPETVYKIASVSKQFIATGIMLLVQEGTIGLDGSVRTYLTDAPDAWRPITIRHLLAHTAGLVREAPGFDPGSAQSDADILRTAYALPLRFTPGERWEYSNAGYYALAEVIRIAAGRPWAEYLADRVFAPSGMLATRTTTVDEAVANRARGYSDNDRLLDAADWPAVRPSGAFLSTVLDLARWDAILYTDRILTASSRRQMWTPIALNDGRSHPYGFGWQLGTGQRRLVYHGGGMPGFQSEFARFVDDGVTVIVLMNLDDADPTMVMMGVAELYLEPPGAR
jgi:CubicO group peptidase (beta-lactamase class C family)